MITKVEEGLWKIEINGEEFFCGIEGKLMYEEIIKEWERLNNSDSSDDGQDEAEEVTGLS